MFPLTGSHLTGYRKKRDGIPPCQRNGFGVHLPARDGNQGGDSCLSPALDRRVFAGRAEADRSAVRQEHGRPARATFFAEAVHEQPVPSAHERADAVIHEKNIRGGRGKCYSRRGEGDGVSIPSL